jgi:hypothetical protein
MHITNISDPLSTHNNTKNDNEYIYYTMKLDDPYESITPNVLKLEKSMICANNWILLFCLHIIKSGLYDVFALRRGFI